MSPRSASARRNSSSQALGRDGSTRTTCRILTAATAEYGLRGGGAPAAERHAGGKEAARGPPESADARRGRNAAGLPGRQGRRPRSRRGPANRSQPPARPANKSQRPQGGREAGPERRPQITRDGGARHPQPGTTTTLDAIRRGRAVASWGGWRRGPRIICTGRHGPGAPADRPRARPDAAPRPEQPRSRTGTQEAAPPAG